MDITIFYEMFYGTKNDLLWSWLNLLDVDYIAFVLATFDIFSWWNMEVFSN